MANSHSYRHGPQIFIRPSADSGTVIERGDICYLDTDDVKTPSQYTWATSDAATQAAIANLFLGIADESKPSGSAGLVNVDISSTSVYEFVCVATTWEVGTPFAIDGNGSNAMFDQVLEKTATVTCAIARSIDRATASTALTHVSFASAYHTGSANSNAFV
jgi:hypothetical protein